MFHFLCMILGGVQPHVSAAIQLSSGTDGRYPVKGDTINYIYTNIQHKNPLLRVAALDSDEESTTLNYDKEKYRDDTRCCRDSSRAFWFCENCLRRFKKEKGKMVAGIDTREKKIFKQR
jgi:hypothetical protein